MLGGELVASGSDSCIFIPNLPCKINGKTDLTNILNLLK